jgi:hypothetical protein
MQTRNDLGFATDCSALSVVDLERLHLKNPLVLRTLTMHHLLPVLLGVWPERKGKGTYNSRSHNNPSKRNIFLVDIRLRSRLKISPCVVYGFTHRTDDVFLNSRAQHNQHQRTYLHSTLNNKTGGPSVKNKNTILIRHTVHTPCCMYTHTALFQQYSAVV